MKTFDKNDKRASPTACPNETKGRIIQHTLYSIIVIFIQILLQAIPFSQFLSGADFIP
jgi:hypothetical protein